MGKKDDRLGETRLNNNGEEMKIVRYDNAFDIDIQFVKDGVILEHRQYDHFKKGQIKNPMFPSVHGVGFIGVGKFKPFDENGKPTRCYIIWRAMFQRCYCSNHQDKYPTYKGCTVDEKWHNFQVFAEWYYENYYEIGNEKMNLDKDILHKGNKVYSPDTCVFVPASINTLFVKCDKARGEYPIGVRKMRNKFEARLSRGNGMEHLGVFNTANEAFLTYKIAKEQYIKEVAEKYKDKIPCELYEAMVAYEVDIND